MAPPTRPSRSTPAAILRFPIYIGGSVSVPMRIFDRNQGEKARTEIEIDRTRRLQESATAQVYSDVDSALNTLNGKPQPAARLQDEVSR